MKLFDKWLHDKMKYLWENSSDYSNGGVAIPEPILQSKASLEADSIIFKLYRASGGFVLEIKPSDYSQYNVVKHGMPSNDQPRLHVIPESADIGDEISKIILIESLRK